MAKVAHDVCKVTLWVQWILFAFITGFFAERNDPKHMVCMFMTSQMTISIRFRQCCFGAVGFWCICHWTLCIEHWTFFAININEPMVLCIMHSILHGYLNWPTFQFFRWFTISFRRTLNMAWLNMCVITSRHHFIGCPMPIIWNTNILRFTC